MLCWTTFLMTVVFPSTGSHYENIFIKIIHSHDFTIHRSCYVNLKQNMISPPARIWKDQGGLFVKRHISTHVHIIPVACYILNIAYILEERGLMNVRKVSTQMSLCSLHKLIRDDTFCLNWMYNKKKLTMNEKYNIGWKCCSW